MARLIKSVFVMLAAVAVVFLAAACGSTGSGQEGAATVPGYLPSTGDMALMFIHRFNEADYDEGKRIVIEGFSEAIDASGQTRRTYFMENEAEAEFVVISYFHPDSSIEEWLTSAGRAEVLASLEPLYREPLEIQQLVVEGVHDTN